MYKVPKLFFTTLLLSTFTFANHVAASECYDPSPNLQILGDKYYDFDYVKTFSNEEKEMLSIFFNSLSGRWRGNAIITDCFGPDNAPEKKYKNATIKTVNQQNTNGGLTINVEKRVIEDRINQSEIVSLLEPSNLFEFVIINDTHIVFSEKFRRANFAMKTNANAPTSNTQSIFSKIKTNITNAVSTKPKDPSLVKVNNIATRLNEIIYEIKLNQGELTIIRSYYTNGVYTGEEAWSLQAG